MIGFACGPPRQIAADHQCSADHRLRTAAIRSIFS